MKVCYRLLYDDEIKFFESSAPPGYLVSIVSSQRHISKDDAISWINERAYTEFEMELNDNTTMREIASCLCQKLNLNEKFILESCSVFYIHLERFWLCIENYDVTLSQIKPFGIGSVLNIHLIYSIFQGDIWRDGQIRYYMPSHEGNRHSKPHVHVVIENDHSATVGILEPEILSGKIPQEYKAKIRKKIEKNKNYLIKCWNNITDGIDININNELNMDDMQA